MAANDPVLVNLQAVPPVADAATLDWRAGGSSPGELLEVYDFDPDAAEHLDLHARVSARYAGANFALRLVASAATATSGNMVWEAAFRRLVTGTSVGASHAYAYQSATVSAPATAGRPVYFSIAFTQAQADGIQAGDAVVVRVRRNAAAAGDTMAGDAELWAARTMAVET